jgi:uncharacterized protein (TIGR00645 family)
MSNRATQGPGPLATLIFASRWLQLPLYLGLILAQCVYVFLFGKELLHLSRARPADRAVDHAGGAGTDRRGMISNLLVMVIVGGYETSFRA